MSRWLPPLRRVLLGLILTLGALALLARLATPLLEHARQPLAAWLGEQLGVPVQIGQLRASWYGLGPRLQLSDLRLGQARQPLHIQRVDIQIAPTGLLSGHLIDMLQVAVTGLHLNLLRNADGHFEVQGLSLPNAASGSGALPLPNQLRLHDLSLDWHDLRAGGRQLRLPQINAQLAHDGDTLRVRASLRSTLGDARFAADIKGRLNSEHWSGNSYLALHGIDLQPLLSVYLPPDYRMHGGTLQGSLWQHWEQARPVRTQGELQLTGLTLGNTDTQQQVTLQQLGGLFHFQRQPDGDWALRVGRLRLQAAGQPAWPLGELAVWRHTAASGQPQISLAAQQLRIGVLGKLLAIHPPDPAWRAALDTLAPHGLLRDLRLRIDPAKPSDWALSSHFSQIGWAPWHKLPGITGLSGRVAATPELINLHLDTQDLALDDPQLFREPLPPSRLQATLYGQRDKDGWLLQSDTLQLSNADLRSRLQLRLSGGTHRPTQLALLGDLNDVRIGLISRYLPAHIVNPELVHWLDSALSTGQVEHAALVVDGPLEDFPFDQRRTGNFQVIAHARDTALHYQQGWPALAHVDARLDFHQNSLDIDLLKGRIYNSSIEQAHASIASLDPTSPLRMSGRLHGPLADPIRLLGAPALRDRFGHIADKLKVSGNSQLALTFQVPLVAGRGAYQLDGKLQFLGDSLRLTQHKLSLTDIRGTLQIGLDALQANGIRANALGAPWRLDVTPLVNGTTLVSARGKLSRAAIARQFPKLPWQQLEGSAEFRIGVHVPGISAAADTPTRVEVSSNLKGMQVKLPAPLGKRATERRPFKVQLALGTAHAPIQVDYGNLDALFSRDGKRGDIRYHSGQASLPAHAGYRLQAKLGQLDLAPWAAFIQQLDSGKPPTTDWQAEIHAQALRYGALQLADVRLNVNGRSGRISGALSSRQIDGQFDYPSQRQAPLRVDLTRAHLALAGADSILNPDKTTNRASRSNPTPDPRELPALRLRIADLEVNQAKLGKLALDSKPLANGLALQQLNIQGASGELLASGSWVLRKGKPLTRLQGSFDTPDLGKLLQALGYSRNVKQAPATGKFNLHWAGNPSPVNLAQLDGNASIALRQGRLADVEPGITRVIGLLSLDALKRRVQLDFGDLLKQGYSFDSIKGSFRFGDGHAFTADLRIKGPSGSILGGGSIGLVKHDFHLVAAVTPNLDTTLPLITTLAGGPVAGVATLLAQQLFPKQVGQIYRFVYSVSGSWKAPKITPLKGGGPLSQIVNSVTGNQAEAQTPAQRKLLQQEATSPGLLERLLNSDADPTPAIDQQPAFRPHGR